MHLNTTIVTHAMEDASNANEKFEPRVSVDDTTLAGSVEDDKLLRELGYVPSFRREFSNLATVRDICVQQILQCLTSLDVDKFRVQYHGSLLQYRYDLQYTTSARRAVLSDLVLDIGSMHVLYPR